MQLEAIQDSVVPLSLNQRKQVSTDIDTQAFRLQMVSFADQYLKPAVATLANQIDLAVLQNFVSVYNYAGSVGTTPATSSTFLTGGATLDNEACPRDGMRCLIISPLMQATIVPALQGLFNPQRTISEQFRKGLMSEDTLGFDWYMDQNTVTFTTGTMGNTAGLGSNVTFTSYTQNNDANGIAIGSAVVTGGWDATQNGVLQPGDVIQIGSVNAINPQSHLSTTQLRNFVVTSVVNSDGGGNATINVAPPIVPAGAYQTVDSAPVAGAAVTVWGVAHPYTSVSAKQTVQGMGFHKDAFTLAFADLPIPGGVDMAGRANDDQLNASIRFVRAYDVQLDRLISRLDLLFGTTTLRPELAVRYPT